MTEEEKYMKRALHLASLGLGTVAPNPMVGCVIVKNGVIIGEGWHRKYGEAHAEVNAVNSVANQDEITESTVYVTLEPCAHFGKTPPCADLLVRFKPKQVLIANEDTHPLVAGGGIAKLQQAGISVKTGVLGDEARKLNVRFFTQVEKNRPYVVLKWAQTADGFVARENFDSKWISNAISRKLVHRWRSEEMAILIGYRTALHDNPHLTTRDWVGKNPVRVVLDREGSLPQHLHLFDGEATTLVITQNANASYPNAEEIVISDWNAQAVLAALQQKKIQSVLVEGGTGTLNLFIKEHLWDEMRVFNSTVNFNSGIKAPRPSGQKIHSQQILNDRLDYYFRKE